MNAPTGSDTKQHRSATAAGEAQSYSRIRLPVNRTGKGLGRFNAGHIRPPRFVIQRLRGPFALETPKPLANEYARYEISGV